MAAPLLENHLPELVQFTHQLAEAYQAGQITDWSAFAQRVLAFYTPDMMDKVEGVVPGWGKMSTYLNHQTLIHVTSVLTTLWMAPEYSQMSAEQQAIMPWMVMFHDIAKVPQPPIHDYIHAFRSAAVTGRALARDGFPVTKAYAAEIDAWVDLTHNAILPLGNEYKQDNSKLPAIISGIDRMYGAHTPSAWIIKGVLLHVSLPTDPDYPTVAPLTSSEFHQYIDEAFFPFMRLMMFVDTDGWNLFDAPLRAEHHQKAAAYFEQVQNPR